MCAPVEPRRRRASPSDRGTIVDHQPRPQRLNPEENITRTIAQPPALVTLRLVAGGSAAPDRCGYVLRDGWRYGMAPPFCDAPALPGSSYCADHRALCVIAPGAAAAEVAARRLNEAAAGVAPSPRELAFLDAAAVAEPEAAAERDDIAACFDLPPGTAARRASDG